MVAGHTISPTGSDKPKLKSRIREHILYPVEELLLIMYCSFKDMQVVPGLC